MDSVSNSMPRGDITILCVIKHPADIKKVNINGFNTCAEGNVARNFQNLCLTRCSQISGIICISRGMLHNLLIDGNLPRS